MKWTSETATGVLSRGEASVVSMACLVGTLPAVDAEQVLLAELIDSEKYRQSVPFGAFAVSVSRYTALAAGTVAMTQDCCGGVIRARAQRRLRRVG